MLTMFLWGKAADRYGRKPVLVVSNLAVAIFTTLFGTSRTIWQLILFRVLAGCFSGAAM
jgi:MFS family permease